MPGQIRVADVNGDLKINEGDKMIIGNNYPKWTGSWNSRADYGALDVAIIAGQLGRGLVIEPFVEVAVLAAQALLPLQHEPPAAAALAELIEGRSIVAPALQPQGAELSETRSGLRLSGAQTLVVGGTRADRFVVAATEGGGLSLLLLDAATPGLRRHDYRLIDGSAACDLHFDEMAIDGHQRLGAPGGAGPVIAAAREQAIVAQCAQALGVMAIRIVSDVLRAETTDGVTRRVKVPAAPGGLFLGLVLLFSLENGSLLAILPDGIIQRMRVGASSALGTRTMARPDARTVGLIGAGAQARR